MQDFAERLYKSKRWQNLRNEYIKSVGGLCEACRSRGILRTAEIVHHKTHITRDNINDEFVTLNWANLEALCRDCHAERHGDAKRYKIDAAGHVTAKI